MVEKRGLQGKSATGSGIKRKNRREGQSTSAQEEPTRYGFRMGPKGIGRGKKQKTWMPL